MRRKIKPYIISIIIALAVGGLSAFLTRSSMEVYTNIKQPPLAPPSVVFPIVWTILFILMGVSSAMVYVKGRESSVPVSEALKIYALQLILNFFWTIIFFNMQSYLFAFIWLVLLWIAIILMIVSFRKVSPAAAWLQVPYLLWVTFAGYLNLMIYILNR